MSSMWATGKLGIFDMSEEMTSITETRATGQLGNFIGLEYGSCVQHLGNWATRQLNYRCSEDQYDRNEGNRASGHLYLGDERFARTAFGQLGN